MTKRIVLALAMVGLSASAFAGHPGNEVAGPSGITLIAPDSIGVWSIGLEALYVENSNNDFVYGQVGPSATVAGVENDFDTKTVNHDHQWGGTIDLTYMFPGNSRDVKLSYTHVDFDNSSNTDLLAGQTFFDPWANISTSVGPDDSIHASQDTDYNSVDLVFGQWIRIGDRLDLHPFAGLRWSSIDDKQRANYFDAATAFTDTARATSDFDGIGPRAGFDAAVHLGYGFSIVGTMGASLLVGDMDTKVREVNQTAAAAFTTVDTDLNQDTHIVPELDARLGIDYLFAFNPTTSMNIQVGYQVVNYFDAIQNDYSDIWDPNNTVSTSDFGYHGPYLRLQLNLA